MRAFSARLISLGEYSVRSSVSGCPESSALCHSVRQSAHARHRVTVLCSVDALQPEPVSPGDELGFVEQSGDGRSSRYSRAVFEFVNDMRLVALKGGGLLFLLPLTPPPFEAAQIAHAIGGEPNKRQRHEDDPGHWAPSSSWK